MVVVVGEQHNDTAFRLDYFYVYFEHIKDGTHKLNIFRHTTPTPLLIYSPRPKCHPRSVRRCRWYISWAAIKAKGVEEEEQYQKMDEAGAVAAAEIKLCFYNCRKKLN